MTPVTLLIPSFGVQGQRMGGKIDDYKEAIDWAHKGEGRKGGGRG